jgi:hypothetical protein
MKRAILFSLIASGAIFAAVQNNNENSTQGPKLSANERVALESSSPRVHLGKAHKHETDIRPGYRVVKDKNTINAFVPVGK